MTKTLKIKSIFNELGNGRNKNEVQKYPTTKKSRYKIVETRKYSSEIVILNQNCNYSRRALRLKIVLQDDPPGDTILFHTFRAKFNTSQV